MSTLEERIHSYEALITEHRNRVAVIEAQPGFNMRDAGFMKLIENEQNLVQTYQTALNILLQAHYCKFLMVIMLYFNATILICLCVVLAFY